MTDIIEVSETARSVLGVPEDLELITRVKEAVERIDGIRRPSNAGREYQVVVHDNELVSSISDNVRDYRDLLAHFRSHGNMHQTEERALNVTAKIADRISGNLLEEVPIPWDPTLEPLRVGDYHSPLRLYDEEFLGVNYMEAFVKGEVARNVRGFEKNPFEPVIRMFEAGLYPRAFLSNEDRFHVDIPTYWNSPRLVFEDTTYHRALLCYLEGDKEIKYMHPWNNKPDNAWQRRSTEPVLKKGLVVPKFVS